MADARTERWAEHRVEARKRIVEAALIAIEAEGPNVSMRRIAEEAKVPKPTLYRFFRDKAEIRDAIGDRLNEETFNRIVNDPKLAHGTVGDFIHVCVIGYFEVLTTRPNAFRFLTSDLFGDSIPASKMFDETDRFARAISAMMSEVASLLGVRMEDPDLTAYLTAGMVTAAGHYALNFSEANGRSLDDIVSQVESSVRGIFAASVATSGDTIDFDRAIASRDHADLA